MIYLFLSVSCTMLLFYIYIWILFSHDITAPGLIGDYAFIYIRQKYCMRFDYTVILKQRCYEKVPLHNNKISHRYTRIMLW